MKIKNTPSLDDIANNPLSLKSLPFSMLADLIDEAKARKSLCDVALKAINSEVESRLLERIAVAYRAEGKDTGTVHIEQDGFDVEINRAKKVEWDQSQLSTIGDKIAAAGDDPHELIKTTYAVEERAYTSWPSSIRAVFEPARTVRPGPLTIKLSAVSALTKVA